MIRKGQYKQNSLQVQPVYWRRGSPVLLAVKEEGGDESAGRRGAAINLPRMFSILDAPTAATLVRMPSCHRLGHAEAEAAAMT